MASNRAALLSSQMVECIVDIERNEIRSVHPRSFVKGEEIAWRYSKKYIRLP
jgi:hypothetical protein